MKISSKNVPVQTLMNKLKRGNILLAHKLQRREGAWNRNQKSLLIDSLLRGYLINPTYTVNDEGIQYTIDGVQRISTIRDYVADVFLLSKNLDPVTIENKTYEIAGKKFSKLDDAVKDELLSAQIQVYEINDYTDKEVRDMFARLNGGKALNGIQRSTPDMSDELSNVVNDIVSHPFFEKVLTPAQLKSSVDLSVALEVLMFSEISSDYDFNSFSAVDRKKFIQYYNDKINVGKVELIRQALDKLDATFDKDVKIPKLSISLCIYGMYRTIKDKKSTEKYIAIIKDFLENYDSNEEYLRFCHDGTSSSEAVKGRLGYFRNMIKTM